MHLVIVICYILFGFTNVQTKCTLFIRSICLPLFSSYVSHWVSVPWSRTGCRIQVKSPLPSSKSGQPMSAVYSRKTTLNFPKPSNYQSVYTQGQYRFYGPDEPILCCKHSMFVKIYPQNCCPTVLDHFSESSEP